MGIPSEPRAKTEADFLALEKLASSIATPVRDPRLDFGDEVRLRDEATGAEKGGKLAQIGLIPITAQIEEAKVYGMGAAKYAPNNWRKGYAWSWSYDALQRHLWSFWAGEDRDPESGLYHLAHARWHTGVLIEYLHHGVGTDDRYKRS